MKGTALIRLVRGLRRWSLPMMAAASMGLGVAASWIVLDPPVLGAVLTGELLAVIAVAVLPLLSFALLRRGHRRDETVDQIEVGPPASKNFSERPPARLGDRRGASRTVLHRNGVRARSEELLTGPGRVRD